MVTLQISTLGTRTHLNLTAISATLNDPTLTLDAAMA